MPRIPGLLAPFLLSLPALLATPPGDADPSRHLSEAGDRKGLEAWSRTRICLHPEEARPHLLLGVALASQGRLPEAAASLQEAVSLAPRMGEGWFDLGLVQARLEDLPGLTATLQTLAEVNPLARVLFLDHQEVQALLPDRAGIPLVKLPKLEGSMPPSPPPTRLRRNPRASRAMCSWKCGSTGEADRRAPRPYGDPASSADAPRATSRPGGSSPWRARAASFRSASGSSWISACGGAVPTSSCRLR